MAVSVDLAKANKLAEAIEQTVALAKYPNVSVKLSSAPTYSLEAYPFRDMTAHLRRCFDAFGPQRCYWGTDMTQFVRQGDLPSAHQPLYRGAALPVGTGQGLGHGTSHPRTLALELEQIPLT